MRRIIIALALVLTACPAKAPSGPKYPGWSASQETAQIQVRKHEYVIALRNDLKKLNYTQAKRALAAIKRDYNLKKVGRNARLLTPKRAPQSEVGKVVPLENDDFCADFTKRFPQFVCSENRLHDLQETKPNDPWLEQYMWALNGSRFGINAPKAWDYTQGSDSVVVAVVDTGLDHMHTDIRANVWVNSGEIAGNGIDDDGNGVIDDVHGYDAVYEDGNPEDQHYHGTHVAGTVAAVGNDGYGLPGVNWRLKVMPVRIFDAQGGTTTYKIVNALDYVTEQKKRGVPIVASNNSWGGGGYTEPVKEAIERQRDEDILFIAAAGNEGRDIDSNPFYPASYDVDNIISVAAHNESGKRAGFSNYGTQNTDLFAPGDNILSTYPSINGCQCPENCCHIAVGGTSMATPHVSGVAALLKSYRPSLNYQQIKFLILDKVEKRAQFIPLTASGGTLDAGKSLEALSATPNPTATPVPTPSPVPTAEPTPVPTAEPTPTPPVSKRFNCECTELL